MKLEALVDGYRDGLATKDELFAAMTHLLSEETIDLATARAALKFDEALRSDFETWLDELLEYPDILLGGLRVRVTQELVARIRASAFAHGPGLSRTKWTGTFGGIGGYRSRARVTVA
jgi:hypothetical protein